MLLSEATKLIEDFLNAPHEVEQQSLTKAVAVWEKTTKEYVFAITKGTPARLVMNHERLQMYEIKATGIVSMTSNCNTVVGEFLAGHLTDETIDALIDFVAVIADLQQHIKNEVDLAWKNI